MLIKRNLDISWRIMMPNLNNKPGAAWTAEASHIFYVQLTGVTQLRAGQPYHSYHHLEGQQWYQVSKLEHHWKNFWPPGFSFRAGMPFHNQLRKPRHPFPYPSSLRSPRAYPWTYPWIPFPPLLGSSQKGSVKRATARAKMIGIDFCISSLSWYVVIIAHHCPSS